MQFHEVFSYDHIIMLYEKNAVRTALTIENNNLETSPAIELSQ